MQDPYQEFPQQPEYSLYPDPQYTYPPPAYPVYAAPSTQGDTLGLLSMIFGIVAIPLVCCIPGAWGLGIPAMGLGAAAVVLGVLGVGKANRGEATNKGMSIAGIACGAIALALAVLWLIFVLALQIGTAHSS